MIQVPHANEMFLERTPEEDLIDRVLAKIVSTLRNEAQTCVDRRKGTFKANVHWMNLPYTWAADLKVVRIEVILRLRDAGYTVTETAYNGRPYGITIEATRPE